MANWSSLPLLPLQLILQQLPLEERMRNCSLVSTSWALAAAAATVHPSSCAFDLNSGMRAKACHLWCLKHQAHAKKVCYSNLRVMSSPLDHRHLQELSISTTWTVRLAASGPQWRGLLQGATALTSLKLAFTSVYGWPEAAQQLTSLKSLTITRIKSKDPGEPHIPGRHLSLLQCLTYLELQEEAAVTAATLQQLRSLSRLQELRLICAEWVGAAQEQEVALEAANSGMGHLQCLTSLHLHGLSPVPVGMSKLAALEELEVVACGVTQPQCFAGGANLKRLTVSDSHIFGQATRLQLLQHLGRMKQLTSLDLHGSLVTFGELWEGATPSEALAGMTSSSSSLQYLNLADCSLPKDAWRSIFRQSGQQLTALRHLTLQDAAPELAANDVKRLAQACPNLHTLNLRDVLQPKVSLLTLTKLTALTQLEVSRVATESAVRALAQLSGLVELRVRQPSQVPRVSRLHLTALKQLRELLLPGCPSGAHDSDDDELEHYWVSCGEEAFSNKGRDVPDVWAQLLLDCHKHMRLPAAQQAEARQAAHKFKLGVAGKW